MTRSYVCQTLCTFLTGDALKIYFIVMPESIGVQVIKDFIFIFLDAPTDKCQKSTKMAASVLSLIDPTKCDMQSYARKMRRT